MLILVTGASKGIGLELVKILSKDPSHLVIAVSRNTTSLQNLVLKTNSHSVMPVKADITRKADQQRLVKLIRHLKLPLDIVIHNAGHIVNKPFLKITPEELQAVYETNVFAPFLLTQQLIPLMGKKTKGHIVTISSMGGVQGSSKFPGLSAYSSSKSALCGLTECLAEELKTRNVAVNCLAIGAVQTEMLSKAFPGYKAPLSPKEMATFISNFAVTGQHYFNGKILPVSSTTP